MKISYLQSPISNKKSLSGGFSLAEIVVVVAIASAIFMAVFHFGESIFSFNSAAQQNLSAQAAARRILKTMVKELRSASPSSAGAYPISLAQANALTFFVNLDDDNLKEQVRYFLQGSELRKGVTKPSGSPLSYNPANEQLTTLVSGLNNGASPIFEYFDGNYAGTTTPLVQPVSVTQVRLIRITLSIDSDPNKPAGSLTAQSQVFLRNLKDNL